MAGLELSELNLPFNLDAEQAVLGSMLVNPDTVHDVVAKLSAAHFKVQLHSDLFSVISGMSISGEDIDIVTVMETAVRKGIFESSDEAKAYLLKLADAAISPSSIESYISIISDKYMVRQLMTVSQEIFELASAGTEETSALLDFAEKKVFDIRDGRDVEGLTHLKTLVTQQLDVLTELSENPESFKGSGLSTSYKNLDNIIFGLNPSDLILIAARPGMGKTSFATNIAANVGKKYPNKTICIFSLEMSKEQIAARILQSEARISSDQMRTGTINDKQWMDIGQAVDVLSQVEIYIDDTASISVGAMKAKLRRMKNLGLVVIDYLQLMSTGRRDGNRVLEISEITRNLKIMAKELNVPVIALSQLSRGPEQRVDKRPMLSDLRDSGSIEQDADIVMFLYRDGYYNKEAQYPNACECIVAKNRHGETGTVPMNWDGQFTRFTGVDFAHGQ
ncbi:MAG: replicative DNA helicase [Oscillospiraceae bacterium]|nr:replicative DNA helicase [Oscillospiraceae bacterium]